VPASCIERRFAKPLNKLSTDACLLSLKAGRLFRVCGKGISSAQLGNHPISSCSLDVHCANTPKKEPMMQTPKARHAFALLVPALLALSISEAAAQKQSGNAAAARAECFRQANEAAQNVSLASPSASAERNSRGVAAYRECARRMGIRP
jgi:hypothetical protein